MEPSAFAKRVSPIISDLVFSVHRKARHEFAEPLIAAEEELGVTVRGLLGNLTEVALANTMTEADATVRGRYAPAGAVQEALDGLLAAGHLNRDGDVLVPADGMRHVLQVAEHARGQAAASLWSDDLATHASEPIPAVMAAAKITDGLLASQLKAPEWPDAPHRLFQRLSRMRYLRNDSHAAAWSAHGLTAGEMVVFTQLWRDQEQRDDPAALAALTERGLAVDGRITDAGRALREQIEDDTNVNDAVAYAALDAAHRVAWLETLDSLSRFEA